MKTIAILVLVFSLFLAITIGYTVYDGKNSGHQDQPDVSIFGNITIRSFGDTSFIMKDNKSPDYQEKISLLENVSANTEKDLVQYDYPSGPLLGVGYGRDEVIVAMHRNWTINETIIREMYSVVKYHGDQAGIQSVPCRFISMGVLKTESSGIPCTKNVRRQSEELQTVSNFVNG